MIKVIIILFISLIVAVAFFFGLKTYQGHKNIQLIDSYLEEKSLKDKIKSEKTEYSAKKVSSIRKLHLKMNLV